MTKTKRCTKCGISYPASFKYFVADKRNKSGLGAECKDCKKIRTIMRHATPDGKEARRVSVQKYDQSEKGKEAQHRSNHKYYYTHLEQIKEYRKTDLCRVTQHKGHTTYRQTLRGHLRDRFYGMLTRCYDPKHVAYLYYGGSGITVDFKDFDDFFIHVTQVMGVTNVEQVKGHDFHRPVFRRGYGPDNLELLTTLDHKSLHASFRLRDNHSRFIEEENYAD